MNGRPGRAGARLAITSLLSLLGLLAAIGTARGASSLQVGEDIYRHGVLGAGAMLEGSREAGSVGSQGADAACVNCHQRSGLGATEGRTLIPPITGRYLFQPRVNSTLPYVASVRGNRDPYTDATLARAVRDGIDSDGKALSFLMPRYALNDADMAALTGYLKALDPHRVPGVTDTVLHFATIITPDADPVKRRGMLDVMQHYFAEKNSFQFGPSRRLQASGKTMYSETMFMVNRRWQLHVWELTGPAASWQAQLQRHMSEEPVLAVVSGLGGANWEPVHRFCEQQRVPCLFPNVDVPVDTAGDFYSLYLSNGVLLEAALIAEQILAPADAVPATTVHQIYRAGDSGEAAARALGAQLLRQGITVHNHALSSVAHGQDLAAALRDSAGAQTLVLWLRPADVASLDNVAAPTATVFISGLMSGLERAPLPSSWRSRTRMAYPVDLPDRRRVRVDYPLGWFSIQRIPLVAEKEQVDTYLACGLLAENLSHMVDTFIPEYLVERVQGMIEHRIITGYYPHLTLATNQHFASKGAYLVHFADPTGIRVVADSDWIVP
jgi:hypothetical protein